MTPPTPLAGTAPSGASRRDTVVSRRLVLALPPIAVAGATGSPGRSLRPRVRPVPASQGALPGRRPAGRAGHRAAPADPGVALGLYQTSFPDDLSAVADLRASTGQGAALVHWYALWGGWKRDLLPDDLERVAPPGLSRWSPGSRGPAKRPTRLGRCGGPCSPAGTTPTSRTGRAVWPRTAGRCCCAGARDARPPGYPWAVGVNGNTAADFLARLAAPAPHLRGLRHQPGAVDLEPEHPRRAGGYS